MNEENENDNFMIETHWMKRNETMNKWIVWFKITKRQWKMVENDGKSEILLFINDFMLSFQFKCSSLIYFSHLCNWPIFRLK